MRLLRGWSKQRTAGSDQGLKPFLVHGAVVKGKVNDAYYSIVTRRDNHAVPTTPEAVHALTAAGRAVFRMGSDAASDTPHSGI